MTTIATDGRTLVCDTMVHGDGAVDPSPYIKTRITEERIYALAGNSALFDPLIRWYEAGANPKNLPAVTPPFKPNVCLWVFEGGKLYELDWDVPHKLEIGVPNAIGSGDRWAIGAMLAGASPEKAVAVAIRCDIYSGGDIRVITLPPHLQIVPPPRAAKLGLQARGGKRRAELLAPERRSEIAREAANARWRT